MENLGHQLLSVTGYDREALIAYRIALSWRESERVHAFCEDYRAGARQDIEDDRRDLAARKTITAPTLVLWGEVFLGRLAESPLYTWQSTFIPNAQGVEVAGGHFKPTGNPTNLTGISSLNLTMISVPAAREHAG